MSLVFDQLIPPPRENFAGPARDVIINKRCPPGLALLLADRQSRPGCHVTRIQASPWRGSAAADELAQVDRGGAPLESGVVTGHAAVAELEAAAAEGADLGDDPLDRGSGGPVGQRESGSPIVNTVIRL